MPPYLFVTIQIDVTRLGTGQQRDERNNDENYAHGRDSPNLTAGCLHEPSR